MSLQRSLNILETLVGFPTVSRNSNLDLIAYIRDLLGAVGVESRLIHNDEGTKANLHAVIGPQTGGGVLLSGHTDVVPTEGQAWTSDAFCLTRRGERLFGRGTADMKAFIACVLAMVEGAAGRRLKRPLHLGFSYDEEIGCIGVRRMIDRLGALADRPAMCIIGEPTLLETVVAHKGKTNGRITCVGRSCHSALAPEGLNAIHLGADMLATLRGLQSEIIAGGTRDEAYAVPFTTLHVGTIQGGTALNIVPRDCRLDFEIRNLPDEDPAPLLARLFDRAAALTRETRMRFAETGVAIEIVNDYPGLNTPGDEAVVGLVGRLKAAAGLPVTGSLGKVAFGTEGGLFRARLGLPTVICGPGDIRDAHQPDESIALDQIGGCFAMLDRLLDDMAA